MHLLFILLAIVAGIYVLLDQIRLRQQAERDLRYYKWNEWRMTQDNQFSYSNAEERKWSRALWESYPGYMLDDVFWDGPDGKGFPEQPVPPMELKKST